MRNYTIDLHGEMIWRGSADSPREAYEKAIQQNAGDENALVLIRTGRVVIELEAIPASNWRQGIRNEEIARGSDD